MLRKIKLIARKRFRWIDRTYGIGEEVDRWCHLIVASAGQFGPAELPSDLLFDELREAFDDPNLEQESFDALEDIFNGVRHRDIRHEVAAFFAFSDKSLPIEIVAIFEVTKDTVVFQFFNDRSANAPDESVRDWP